MSVLNLRTGILAAAILGIGACGGSRVEPPDVKLNPSPKQRYEITVAIEDPPEPVRDVTGTAQLNIDNKDCMPLKDKIAGIKPDSSFTHFVKFNRAQNDKFVGYVYTDKLLDEDYYGLGKCKWKITGIVADIHVGKAKQSAVLDGDKVASQNTQTSFCFRDVNFSFGCLNPIDDVTEKERESRFTVVLKSRKVML